METKEFIHKAKELAVISGLNRKDISIRVDGWINIVITCTNADLYSKLKADIEKLAGLIIIPEVYGDYFEYKMNVKTNQGGNYRGLIIIKGY